MNRKTLFLACLSMCGVAFAGAAFAKDDHFKMMDANSDGKVSSAEHAAAVTKMFGEMDADKDGFVTTVEMDATHAKMWKDKEGKDMKAGEQGMKKMSSADKIAKMDTDGDGKLSSAEHDAGAATMFTSMDKDGDGALTMGEMESGMQRASKDAKAMDHSGHDMSDKAQGGTTTPQPTQPPADDNGG